MSSRNNLASAAWKTLYREPKGDGVWTLPEAPDMVNHLRMCGGLVARLVDQLADSEFERDAVSVQIFEKLSLPENEEHLKAWEQLSRLGQKSSYKLGEDRILIDFSNGRTKHASLVQKLGASLFATSTKVTDNDDPGLAMLEYFQGLDGQETQTQNWRETRS